MIQVPQPQVDPEVTVFQPVRVDQVQGLERRILLGEGEKQRDGIVPFAVNVSVYLYISPC